jgi:secreted Zn-dependent insulinase-like peptidase
MKLAVSSKHSIDQLEQWVRNKFSDIQNKNVELPDLSEPVAPYTKENLSQLIKFVPIENKNTMSVVWYLPDYHSQAYGSSPLSYFVHILNDRSNGSL